MDKLCFSFMSEKEHNTTCFVGMLYSSINNVIEVLTARPAAIVIITVFAQMQQLHSQVRSQMRKEKPSVEG